jgi:phosphoglycerol transferase MdoB-like AlkP superfamily enzyme
VDDYNLFSDKFRIESEISKHRKIINELKLPIDSEDFEDLGLAPFDRIIYIVTESLSLKALPCYNSEIKTDFATNFFCSDKIQDSTFQNLYTTGSPTLQGLTVIFNSHPNYKIQEPTGQRNSFPKLLEKNGYKPVFIRSASKYFANQNLVFKNMGFSEIIGREDFYEDKNLRKYIYGWGLEDRILYKKVVEYLDENRDKKIFTTVFGTDTHPPYGQKHYKHLSYPSRPELKKYFNNNSYEWIRAVDNMDFDINNFLKELEMKDLFDEKTLIIISADHSCPLNNVSRKIPGHPKNNLARIPLIFLSKQTLPEMNKDILASQVDIAPTIFHLLGLKKNFGWWGESLFSKKRYPYAVGYEKGFVRINSADYEKLINTDNPKNKSEEEFADMFNTIFYKPE